MRSRFFRRAQTRQQNFFFCSGVPNTGESDRSTKNSARKESRRSTRKRAKFLQSQLNRPRDRIPRRLRLQGTQTPSQSQLCGLAKSFARKNVRSRQFQAPAASLRNLQTRAPSAATASVLHSVPDFHRLSLLRTSDKLNAYNVQPGIFCGVNILQCRTIRVSLPRAQILMLFFLEQALNSGRYRNLRRRP